MRKVSLLAIALSLLAIELPTALTDPRIYTIAGNSPIHPATQNGVPAVFATMFPSSMALDEATGALDEATGSLYYNDGGLRIRRIDGNGNVTTVAGNGLQTTSSANLGDGGLAVNATLGVAWGISITRHADGVYLYIADIYNCRIRRVRPNGIIDTVAGSGPVPCTDGSTLPAVASNLLGDGGPATNARIAMPFDVKAAVFGPNQDALYIADLGHNRVRRVLPNGTMETFAGTGAATDMTHPLGDGGTATAATFNQPGFLAIAGTSLYVNDLGNGRIRRISAQSIITTVAGNGDTTPGPDGARASAVGLGNVNGFDVDASGAIYFAVLPQASPAEATANQVRRIAPDGTLRTIAGVGGPGTANLGDGGDPLAASIDGALEVRVSSAGRIFISETGHGGRIRVIRDPATPTTNRRPYAYAHSSGTVKAGIPLGFNGGQSVDTDGTIVIYSWEFSDGGTATGASVTHAFAAEGAHWAKLTVTDDLGASHSHTADVSVQPYNRPVANAGPDITVKAGVTAAFNGSGQAGEAAIRSYRWAFGDGTFANGAIASHAYSAAGTYTATLTVTDQNLVTGTDTAIVVVQPLDPPVAAVPAPTLTGIAGHPVGFSATGSRGTDAALASLQWNFGDGTTGSGFSPTHIYASPGTYTAVLTVTDTADGTATASVVVTVRAHLGPIANAGPDQSVGIGYSVAVDGSSSAGRDGAIVSYAWTFGDGAAAPGATASRLYAEIGIYTATLTVTDAFGAIGTDTARITVTPPQNPHRVIDTIATDVVGGVAILEGSGSVYFINASNRVVRRDANANLTNVAGNGTAGFSGDGGPATSAALMNPAALAVVLHHSGPFPGLVLYIADTGNHRIRRVLPNGVIQTVAGNGTRGFSGDGGPATAAELGLPAGLVVTTDGANDTIYFTEFANGRVRRVQDGTIQTIAGNGNSTTLHNPFGLARATNGALYISEMSSSGRIHKLENGVMSTVAAGALDVPRGLGIDSAGALYIADSGNNRIRRLAANGAVETISGIDGGGFSGDRGPASAARLSQPSALAVSSRNGDVYFVDFGNRRLRRIYDSGAPIPTLLTVTADNQQRLYGEPNPPLTGSVSGAVNDGDVSIQYETVATVASGVGTYDIRPRVVIAEHALQNYLVETVAGTLTVDPAPLEIAADFKTRSYRSDNPPLTGRFVVAPRNDDTLQLAFTTSARLDSPVGDYAITVSAVEAAGVAPGSVLGNYSLTAHANTLRVTRAPLKVTAADASRVVGAVDPAFTATVTGLLGGDAIVVKYRTTATAMSLPGAYPIEPRVEAAAAVLANYDLTLVNGTLTVLAPRSRTSTFLMAPSLSAPGEEVRAKAYVQRDVKVHEMTGTVTLMDGATAIASTPIVPATAPFAGPVAQHNIGAARPSIAPTLLNDDWWIDAVVLKPGGRLAAFVNGPSGFHRASDIVLGGDARAMVHADIDSDGIADYVTAETDGRVRVHTGRADGTFQTTAVAVGTSLSDLASGTFSGPPIFTAYAVVEQDPAGHQVALVRVDTAGNVTLGAKYPAPEAKWVVNFGHTFFAVGGKTVTVFELQSDGTLAQRAQLALPHNASSVWPSQSRAFYFDDGAGVDIPIGTDGGQIAMLVSDGTAYSVKMIAAPAPVITAIELADFGGSGFESLLVAGGDGGVWLMRNRGPGHADDPFESVKVAATAPVTAMSTFIFTTAFDQLPLPYYRVDALMVSGQDLSAAATLDVLAGGAGGTATFTLPELALGGHSLTARYDGEPNFFPSTSPAVPHVVLRDPGLTWSSPAAIAYGTALDDAQLRASAGPPGTLRYSPAAGTILDVGEHTLAVTFTPADPTQYSAASATVRLRVTRATPVITWVNPAAITYGARLGSNELSATANVGGTFTYSPAAGDKLDAGTGQTLRVSFVPNDTTRYEPANAEVTIAVHPATPTVSWANPAEIVYGERLGDTQLNASANVLGAFNYKPAAGEIVPAGEAQTLSVEFVSSDPNYSRATATVTIKVKRALPTVTWHDPAPIAYGTRLGDAQLTATAPVPGEFRYSPAAGTLLSAGTHTLKVEFSPADSANYQGSEAEVSLRVDKAEQVITWPAPASIVYGARLDERQLNATVRVPGATPAGTLTYLPPAGTLLDAGRHTLLVDAAETDNYRAARLTVEIEVLPAEQRISWADPPSLQYGNPLGPLQNGATVAASGPASPGQLTFLPPNGARLDAGVHTLTVKAAATNNYREATKSVQLSVTRAPLSVFMYAPPGRYYYDEPAVKWADGYFFLQNGDSFRIGLAGPGAGTPAGIYRPSLVFDDPGGRARNYTVGVTDLFHLFNPAAVVTSMSRNTAVAGSDAFDVTFRGDGFVPNCGSQCPPPDDCPGCRVEGTGTSVLWNGVKLPVTFVSRNEIRVRVSADLVAQIGVAYLTIGNPLAPGNPAMREFFVTRTATTIKAVTTTTSSGEPMAMSAGDPPTLFVTTAGGGGTITIATYGSNPGAAFKAGAGFFDVFVAPGSSFTALTIRSCPPDGIARVFWFDGDKWHPASDQKRLKGDPVCIEVTINDQTSPSLAQLSGTFFAYVQDEAPPLIAVTVDKTELWPPNGKLVPVVVSGRITDESPLAGAAYAVADEYGQVEPSGAIAVAADGTYRFTLMLPAARNGGDKDGRRFTVRVNASDSIGNAGSAMVLVVVPHD